MRKALAMVDIGTDLPSGVLNAFGYIGCISLSPLRHLYGSNIAVMRIGVKGGVRLIGYGWGGGYNLIA